MNNDAHMTFPVHFWAPVPDWLRQKRMVRVYGRQNSQISYHWILPKGHSQRIGVLGRSDYKNGLDCAYPAGSIRGLGNVLSVIFRLWQRFQDGGNYQENTIERHHYGGAGWLVWGGIILGSRTDLHDQSVTMTDHIYRDVILEQNVRLFRGAMGAEFLFMDDNARLHSGNIKDECLQSEEITRMDWPAY
ncbi:transposable element Tcb1 transposase [Trichonephila clavipes]|nr:transposable element Tcb1 transposase [Trichonephila clavipes]